jgi:chromosome segregation ATPase
MRRRFLILALPLLLAGCVSPLTRRLDEANARAAAINEQLIIATAKLEEANAILERSERKLDEANRTFYHLDERIGEMDKKFGTVEVGLRKMFGIRADGLEE